MDFTSPYYQAPVVITTATHVKKNIAADDNAITEWTQVGYISGVSYVNTNAKRRAIQRIYSII